MESPIYFLHDKWTKFNDHNFFVIFWLMHWLLWFFFEFDFFTTMTCVLCDTYRTYCLLILAHYQACPLCFTPTKVLYQAQWIWVMNFNFSRFWVNVNAKINTFLTFMAINVLVRTPQQCAKTLICSYFANEDMKTSLKSRTLHQTHIAFSIFPLLGKNLWNKPPSPPSPHLNPG